MYLWIFCPQFTDRGQSERPDAGNRIVFLSPTWKMSSAFFDTYNRHQDVDLYYGSHYSKFFDIFGPFGWTDLDRNSLQGSL